MNHRVSTYRNAVLKARAEGHVIMYSDRVTPFIARIEAVLET